MLRSDVEGLLRGRIRAIREGIEVGRVVPTTVDVVPREFGKQWPWDGSRQRSERVGFVASALVEVELVRLEWALSRLAVGKYGYCFRCANALDAQRLQADPAAAFCDKCLRMMIREETDAHSADSSGSEADGWARGVHQ